MRSWSLAAEFGSVLEIIIGDPKDDLRVRVVMRGLDAWTDVAPTADVLAALGAFAWKVAQGEDARFAPDGAGVVIDVRTPTGGRAGVRVQLFGWSPTPFAIDCTLSAAAETLSGFASGLLLATGSK